MADITVTSETRTVETQVYTITLTVTEAEAKEVVSFITNPNLSRSGPPDSLRVLRDTVQSRITKF